MEKFWLQRFAQGAEGGAEGSEAAPAEAPGTQEQPSLPERQEEVQREAPREPDPMVERHWRRVDAIYDGWMAQARELEQIFPGFDLRRELGDERFAGMLLSGVDMASAYQALHAGEILPAAMEYAARTVENRLAQAMRTGAYRPGENGLDSGASALTGRSVTKMTRQDYDRVCRMVERGERVSFG